MKWRCDWCGKPQEENDPPCDNCGHGTFEKAVQPMGPESSDGSVQPVWACTECGREHQKHSPPCSRCGNANLEKRQPDYSDLEPDSSTGWLDILEPKYAAGYLLVGLLVVVLGLGGVGAVDLPTLGTAGAPSPPAAPGDADTTDGISLSAAESEFVATINAERAATGMAKLSRGETLGTMAAYYNKRRVEAAHADAENPTLSELDPYEPRCGGSRRIVVLTKQLLSVQSLDANVESGGFQNATQMATVVAEAEGPNGDSLGVRLTRQDELSRVGVDVHVAPDDTIYVTVVGC